MGEGATIVWERATEGCRTCPRPADPYGQFARATAATAVLRDNAWHDELNRLKQIIADLLQIRKGEFSPPPSMAGNPVKVPLSHGWDDASRRIDHLIYLAIGSEPWNEDSMALAETIIRAELDYENARGIDNFSTIRKLRIQLEKQLREILKAEGAEYCALFYGMLDALNLSDQEYYHLLQVFEEEEFDEFEARRVFDDTTIYKNYLKSVKSAETPDPLRKYISELDERRRRERILGTPVAAMKSPTLMFTNYLAGAAKDFAMKEFAVFDMASYFIPYVGPARMILEGMTGRNVLTGEQLKTWERALSLLPVAGKIAQVGKQAMKTAVQRKAAAVFFSLSVAFSHADAAAKITKMEDRVALVLSEINQAARINAGVFEKAMAEMKAGRLTAAVQRTAATEAMLYHNRLKSIMLARGIAPAGRAAGIPKHTDMAPALLYARLERERARRRSARRRKQPVPKRLPPRAVPESLKAIQAKIRLHHKALLKNEIASLNKRERAIIKEFLAGMDEKVALGKMEAVLNKAKELSGVPRIEELAYSILPDHVSVVVKRPNDVPIFDLLVRSKKPGGDVDFVIGEAKGGNSAKLSMSKRTYYDEHGNIRKHLPEQEFTVKEGSGEWFFNRIMEIRRTDPALARELFESAKKGRVRMLFTRSSKGNMITAEDITYYLESNRSFKEPFYPAYPSGSKYPSIAEFFSPDTRMYEKFFKGEM